MVTATTAIICRLSSELTIGITTSLARCIVHWLVGTNPDCCLVPVEDEMRVDSIHQHFCLDVCQEFFLNFLKSHNGDLTSIGTLLEQGFGPSFADFDVITMLSKYCRIFLRPLSNGLQPSRSQCWPLLPPSSKKWCSSEQMCQVPSQKAKASLQAVWVSWPPVELPTHPPDSLLPLTSSLPSTLPLAF